MLKKEKQTQNKKSKYLRKDSSFNIRDLVMRTPTSTSASRSPEVYAEEKQIKIAKQDAPPKPSQAELLKSANEKLEGVIQELRSFDVSTIQRRSDPRMKALTGRINDSIAEVFGRDTEEYDEHVIYSLDTLPMTIGGSWHPLPEVREGYQKGIQSAITRLSALLDTQSKKFKAVTSEKTVRLAPKESNHSPIVLGNEKISLVNLRGKIKSRETAFFTTTQPANGKGQTASKALSDVIVPGDAVKNEYLSTVSFENNEAGDSCCNEPTLEEVPFSSLMAKLNEVVASDPEYAEAFMKTDVEGKKGLAETHEQEDQESQGAVSDVWCNETSIHIGEPEALKIQAEDEILVIDGDNLLSSGLSFIENLDNDSKPEKTIQSEHLEKNTGYPQEGTKRISLEALEEKLRELEEKEDISEILTDDEQSEDEEILLIEGTDDLPEEMMGELSRQAGQGVIYEEKFVNEEILVIDGDEGLSIEPASLESINEVSLADGLAVTQEEVLVIECDNGLPEDVSYELPDEEILCEETEGEVHGVRLMEDAPQGRDLMPPKPIQDGNVIIELFSQATTLDIPLQNRDEDRTRAVLLEDLELRTHDIALLQRTEDFPYNAQFYRVEEEGQVPESDVAAHTLKEDQIDVCDSALKEQEASSIVAFFGHDFLTNETIDNKTIDTKVHVKLEQGFVDFRLPEPWNIQAHSDTPSGINTKMPAESIQENSISKDIVDGSFLELSEMSVYGYESGLELQEKSYFYGEDAILYYNVKLDLIENGLLPEPEENAPERENIIQQISGDLSEQILPKEMVFLSDEEHEAFLDSSVSPISGELVILEDRDESPGVSAGEMATCDAVAVVGSDVFGQAELTDFEGLSLEGAMIIAGGEELMNDSRRVVAEDEEVTGIGFVEFEISSEQQNLFDEGLRTIDAEEEFKFDADHDCLEEHALVDNDSMHLTGAPQFDSDQEFEFPVESSESGREPILTGSEDDSASEPVHVENCIVIPEMHDMVLSAHEDERNEISLLDVNDAIFIDGQDGQADFKNLETLEGYDPSYHLEGSYSDHEPLSVEAFEKYLDEPQHSVLTDGSIESTPRDNILLEALEEMLSNLETNVTEQSNDQPVQANAQSNPPQETEKIHIVESNKEPQKKAVLIKTKEERDNPFAVTELGREKAQAKTFRADDLLAQIGELRYRVDDLKTFDIDSIDQRFDPKVRALGDSVNNTLSEIFGRNTPSYWQHALPSLDSLPVVVGGPKLSLEELRDAYRRRINDAISKVKITIDVLEVKLGNLQDKGAGGQVLFFSPKEPKYPDIQSLR